MQRIVYAISSASSKNFSRIFTQMFLSLLQKMSALTCRGQKIINEFTFNFLVSGVILENTYLLTCHHVSKRSTEPHLEVHTDLNTHSKVSYADQQVVKSRTKRQLWTRPRPPQQQQSFPPQTQFDDLSHFNDQRWAQMWYLNRGNKLDMNVQEAWQMGATGKGIAVTILDDGIERTHPDLVANYDPLASFDVNQNDNDPTPRYDLIDSNRHGNYVTKADDVVIFAF